MHEPGLDRHEWESEWESLQEELADDPAATLVALDRLVAEFRAAHEVTQANEAGRDVDPGDVAMAVNAYQALYEHVINDRTAP